MMTVKPTLLHCCITSLQQVKLIKIVWFCNLTDHSYIKSEPIDMLSVFFFYEMYGRPVLILLGFRLTMSS